MRRRKYFINRSIQARYMGMVAVLVAIMCIFTSWTVYTTMWGGLSELAGEHPLLYPKFTEMNRVLASRILLLISGGAAASLVITLFISHRVAGPLYRMDRVLAEIASGNIPPKAKFRKKDEFKELAESVNSALDRLEKISEENSAVIESVSKLVEEGAPPDSIMKKINQLSFLKKNSCREDSGFTLLELLVSMAVMMILAGLLLSTLAGARNQVGRTACLNELRQIGIATFMYAQDYAYIYPALDTPEMRASGRIRIPQERPSAHGLLFPAYIDRIEIFGCPSSNYARPEDVKDSWGSEKGVVHSAYLYRGMSGGIGSHRLDSLEREEKPSLLMDYNRPDDGELNHAGAHVNVLSAAGAAAGFPDQDGKLSISEDKLESFDAAFIEADSFFTAR